MITIEDWQEYTHRLAAENSIIKHNELVVNIPQLKEKIKELDLVQYPILAAIVPYSSSATEDEDNVSELNTLNLLVLQPLEAIDSKEEELVKLSLMQTAIVEIKRQIRADYFRCDMPIMREVKFKSFVTEPVYNLLGYYGWILKFELETGEYETIG